MATARVTLEARASGEIRLRLRAAEGPAAQAATPLSTIATNFKTPRYNCIQAGYGALPAEPRKYTTYARRITRECAGVLEEEYGENCWFCTLTLPGSSAASIASLAEYSSYVMARVRQWFRDYAPGAEIIAVWELQKRGALHLHLACGGVPPTREHSFKSDLHAMWCNLLAYVSELKGVDLFGRAHGGTWATDTTVVQVDAQRVRKSVARYLGKYISKASVRHWTKETLCPTRWWGCTRSLLHKAQRARVTVCSGTQNYVQASEWFEALAGKLASNAQATFAIDNVFRPGDRCLSIWMSSSEVARTLAFSACQKVDAMREFCYDSLAEKCTPLQEFSQTLGGFALAAKMFKMTERNINALAQGVQGVVVNTT